MACFCFAPSDRKQRGPRRRGAFVIAALGCLAVAVVLFVLLAKQAVLEHQATQANQRNMQAAWLAEAGIERAVYRLAADPKYTGETWTVTAQQLAADDGGVVRITVHPSKYQPKPNSRYTISVVADFPDASQFRCRFAKEIVVADREKIRTRQQPKKTS